MSYDKILAPASALKFLSVKIDGVPVINDDIVSIEINYDFFKFGVQGSMKINDSFDMGNNTKFKLNGNNKVVISMIDLLKKKYTRTFRIISAKSTIAQERFKILDFTLIDEITFMLSNTYISKSFTGTLISAFSTYLTHIGVDTLMNTDKLSYDIVDSTTSTTFTIPQDKSLLEYFQYFFRKQNIRIWQDRDYFHVKSVVPSTLVHATDPNGQVLTYTNKTLNNDYVFKIHDISEIRSPVYAMNNTLPARTIYYHDYHKTPNFTNRNLTDVFSAFELNPSSSLTSASDLQLTDGFRLETQTAPTNGSQDYDLLNTYSQNGVLALVTRGSLEYSSIGTLAKVDLKGNPMYSDTVSKGDVLSSGNYFIGSVSDRIIGDKFINKVVLHRLDPQEPK